MILDLSSFGRIPQVLEECVSNEEQPLDDAPVLIVQEGELIKKAIAGVISSACANETFQTDWGSMRTESVPLKMLDLGDFTGGSV